MATDPCPAIAAAAGANLYVSGQTKQWGDTGSAVPAVPGSGFSRPRSTLKAARLSQRGVVMRLAGADGYPSLPNPVPDGNGYYGETIMAWVFIEDIPEFFGDPQNLQIMNQTGFLITGTYTLHPWKGTDTKQGVLRFVTDSFGTVYSEIVGQTKLNDGRPHHIAITRYGKNGSDVTTRLYVDGLLDAEIVQNPYTFYLFDATFSAGISSDVAFAGWIGEIAHITHFGRALSPTEVLAQAAAGNLAPTLQYNIWTFDPEYGWITMLESQIEDNIPGYRQRYWNGTQWVGKPVYP